MVIGAFPAAKLGLLAIRQVSKPIANVIKDNAKKSKFFRDYVCMPPAQMYNWVEVKTKMWALNLGKPVSVPPLNEAMAIELGANLLGEFIIFFIGSGVLIFEYTRQTNNEAKKQEVIRQEKAELIQQLAELGFRLEKQDTQIRELTRVLAGMGQPIKTNGESEAKVAKDSKENHPENKKQVQDGAPHEESSKKSHSIFRWGKERISEYETFDANEPDQSVKVNSDYNGNNGNESCVSKALNYLIMEIFADRQKDQNNCSVDVKLKTSEQDQFRIRTSSSSDYDSNGSTVSRALNYLETEIFIDKRKEQRSTSEEEELQPYVINEPQPSFK